MTTLACFVQNPTIVFAHRDASHASPCFRWKSDLFYYTAELSQFQYSDSFKKRRVNNYIFFKTVREKELLFRMKSVRMLDTHEETIGLSGHLLAVSRKEAKT